MVPIRSMVSVALAALSVVLKLAGRDRPVLMTALLASTVLGCDRSVLMVAGLSSCVALGSVPRLENLASQGTAVAAADAPLSLMSARVPVRR